MSALNAMEWHNSQPSDDVSGNKNNKIIKNMQLVEIIVFWQLI